MSIFVQREGETYGPFSREEVLEHLRQGVLLEDDLACTEDNLKGRPLKVVLGEEPSRPETLEIAQQAIPRLEDTAQDISGEADLAVGNPEEGDSEQGAEGEPAVETGASNEIPLLDPQLQDETDLVYLPAEEQPRNTRKALLIAGGAGCFLIACIAGFFLFKPRPPSNPPAMMVTTSSSLPAAEPTAASKPAASDTPIQQDSKPEIATTQEVPTPAAVPMPMAVVPPPVPATGDEAMPQTPPDSQTAGNGNGMDDEQNTDANSVADNNTKPEKRAPAAHKPPAPPLAAAHQIALPREKGIPRGDLWVADTASNPKAILVLCLSPNGNSQNAVKNRDWQDFAKENEMALVAIAFGSDQDMLKPDTGNPRAGSAAENILITGLQGYFGNTVPLILYGHEAGGTFAANVANWHPEIVRAWGAYTNDWPAVTQASRINPPGILACDNEVITRGKTKVQDFFLAGRAQDKPWILIPVAAPPETRGKAFDSFFCDYVKALVSPGADPKGVWVGIESKKLFSTVDRMRDPKGAEWMPDASLIDSWTSLMSTDAVGIGGKPTILQKDIETFNPKQPHLKLYLRLPSTAKSGKDVGGVLAYCTWDNNESKILATLGIQGNEKLVGLDTHHTGTLADLISFAEMNNLAVLTWGTTDASINYNVDNKDMDAKEQYELDLGFDALATAWEKGVSQFANETGIPRSDFLLYGISRGAQWAHRLALRKPDYFLAVHIHISSSYDVPTPDASGVMWLITTGEMDYGYPGSMKFYKECRQLGYPIMFKAIMGLGHNDDKIADDLGLRFFQYALSLRDIHDQHEYQKRMHLAVRAAQSTGTWLQPFQDPAFIGDLLNQDCYPSTQIDMVPDTLRVPLPTKTLADAWNK